MLLTVGQQIPVGTGGVRPVAPWSANTNPITFVTPSLSYVTVSDDDDRFQTGRYSPTETGQVLADPAVFQPNGTPVPAGSSISFYAGSILRDTLQNADGSWNEFQVLFPRSFVAGQNGVEYGDRYSVLIIPRQLPNGSYPSFDLSHSYRFRETYSVGTSGDSVAYPLQQAVPCFAAGSVIATPQGSSLIEDLQAGDRVTTGDSGVQVIRWIGATHVDARRLDLQPNLRPITIRKGALGPDLPADDLTVSPQHRVLVRSRIGRRLFGEDEVLVAAKHLLGLPGIEVRCPAEGVTYYHMLFDRHELVLSNGAWTESLFPGPQAMHAVGAAARREILSLFPELAQTDSRPQGARRFLSGREARSLSERHLRNLPRRRLVETL